MVTTEPNSNILIKGRELEAYVELYFLQSQIGEQFKCHISTPNYQRLSIPIERITTPKPTVDNQYFFQLVPDVKRAVDTQGKYLVITSDEDLLNQAYRARKLYESNAKS